jgi:hypothetical protein
MCRAETVQRRLYAERQTKRPRTLNGRATIWKVYDRIDVSRPRYQLVLIEGEFYATGAGFPGRLLYRTSRAFARLLSIVTFGD